MSAATLSWEGVELWETRSGKHHLSRTNGKPMLCGRTMIAGLDHVYEAPDELSRMINEPANIRYLCHRCAQVAHKILSATTQPKSP